MTIFAYPVFIPVYDRPRIVFEGPWQRDERDAVEYVLQRRSMPGRPQLYWQKRWLLVCHRIRGEATFHAAYSTEVAMYAETADALARQIDDYCLSGQQPVNPLTAEITDATETR